jgi:hypothetical protein
MHMNSFAATRMTGRPASLRKWGMDFAAMTGQLLDVPGDLKPSSRFAAMIQGGVWRKAAPS